MTRPSCLIVVTNNERVASAFGPGGVRCGDVGAVEFVLGTPVDVLERVVVLLQDHRRLVSALLPPNGPMMRAPFRSILLEESAEKYDIAGIGTVERARKAMAKRRAIASAEADGDAGEDFARIDETHLDRAIRDYGIISRRGGG
jgi:hypothetical protein